MHSGMQHLWKKCFKFSISKRPAHVQRAVQRHYGLRSRTVYALSSGRGKCAVAVIRVSGPKSAQAVEKMCVKIPPQRKASLLKLYDPNSKELLDKALVLWFPGPGSFTGEDCAEFHVHGGPAVVKGVLEALGSLPDLRPAEPGEFTKQAFLNGKLDLTEVEGLGDLIHAETEAQRKQALRQMDGDLAKLYSTWRSRLIKCLANIEAFIDFHEEENIEDDILDSVLSEVYTLTAEVKKHLNDERHGERLRDGLNVVIVGEPNVGKSSLLNSVCQRPAAIVSPFAGTTRDVVETALNIAGYPVVFSDTAGLRQTTDVIEREGIDRAMKRVSSSDLIVLVVDVQRHVGKLKTETLSEFVISHMESLGIVNSTELPLDSGNTNISLLSNVTEKLSSTIIVLNKVDLLEPNQMPNFLTSNQDNVCAVSCLTGQGFDNFMEILVDKTKQLCGDPLQGSPSLTQTRHRYHLHLCLKHLTQFPDVLPCDVVLAAERLRVAAGELGQITGIVSAEDVLDVIFNDFCIGK